MFMGFPIRNHPFWGIPISGNPHMRPHGHIMTFPYFPIPLHPSSYHLPITKLRLVLQPMAHGCHHRCLVPARRARLLPWAQQPRTWLQLQGQKLRWQMGHRRKQPGLLFPVILLKSERIWDQSGSLFFWVVEGGFQLRPRPHKSGSPSLEKGRLVGDSFRA